MKKALYSIVAVLIFMFMLTGCAKYISTETSTVRVKVVDEYYRATYMTPIFNSETTTTIIYPEVYRITVEYDGRKYNIFDSSTYNKYSDRIGEYVNGTLETKKYDDGTVRYNIVDLE